MSIVNRALELRTGVYYPSQGKHRIKKKNSRIKTDRAILKDGVINVERPYQTQGKWILSKWFMNMVEARWRWTLFSFVLAFAGDWLLFGTLYWVISNVHGDLVEDHLPPNQNATNWTPCIENIYGFVSTFLFSVEVHTTVAYGDRSITLECPQAISIMCLQCIVSSIFQAFMVGILFAKLTRPKNRTHTILFSKIAAVSMRDEKLNLIFRVGDIRKSRILNIKAKAFKLKHDMGHPFSDEVEQTELKLEIIECESFFFMWPVSFVHVIDQDSPLHTVSAADLLCSKLEILVIFEGIIESTGQSIQARSSYTETEVLWGHRFVPIVKYDQEKNGYDVDFSRLSNTVHVDTPLCSANELDSLVTSIKCSYIQRYLKMAKRKPEP